MLLRIAGLLHEVGVFVSDRSHHKHSMYLILNSDLFGLTRKEITLIALVARYHRRAMPRPYHTDYTSLDRDSRLVVAKPTHWSYNNGVDYGTPMGANELVSVANYYGSAGPAPAATRSWARKPPRNLWKR